MKLVSLIELFVLWAFRFRMRGFLRVEAAPESVPPPPPGGAGYLYLHVPFCEKLPRFCAFHRVERRRVQAQRYFHSLRADIPPFFWRNFD